jgi:flagellar basal-body rod protein FlgB
MIGALFNQSNYVAAKSMLDVTELRQQAIAANIANVETPGYKRLEVSKSFEAEFERAIGTKDEAALRDLRPTLEEDRTAIPGKRDGNTVRIEDELLAMSKNQLEHALETRLVTGTLLKIRMAITGKS